MKKMMQIIISGTALISLVLIIGACTTPSSTNISSDLSAKNRAVAPSPQATATSMVVPVTCQVSALAISPTKVNPGEEATITAYIMNPGDEEVSYISELEINNVVAQVIEVAMPARRTQSVAFQVTKDEPGTYEVNCGGVTGQLVVINTIIPPKSNPSLLNPAQSNSPSCCPAPSSGQSSIPSVFNNPDIPAPTQKSSTPSCCAK